MNIEPLIKDLARNVDTLHGLVQDVSAHQAHWRPDDASWSIVEVINHLVDEEREDFRQRLDLLLHDPSAPWPPIDPPGWVIQRRYNERALSESWQCFAAERDHSIAWLRGLDAPDWNVVYQHPQAGALHAGNLLHAWVAHDYLHARQLVELRYLYLADQAQPYSVAYAGEW